MKDKRVISYLTVPILLLSLVSCNEVGPDIYLYNGQKAGMLLVKDHTDYKTYSISTKDLELVKSSARSKDYLSIKLDFSAEADQDILPFKIASWGIDSSFALKEGECFSVAILVKGDYDFAPIDIVAGNSLLLKSISLVPYRIGYDLTEGARCFYLGPSGGNIPCDAGRLASSMSPLSYDFTPALALLGSAPNYMPVLKLKALSNGGKGYKATVGGVTFDIGEPRGVNDDGGYTTTIVEGATEGGFSTISLEQDTGVISAFIEDGGATLSPINSPLSLSPVVLAPLVCDTGLIIGYNKDRWRTKDYELFSWEDHSNILIFDTKDYDTQADFFTRLAYYAEKAGYRGTIVSDAVIRGKHGYNAHDYSAQSLADFFDEAQRQNFPLNQKERLLKEILLANGIIEVPLRNDGSGRLYKAGEGAVISISQESPLYLRRQLLNHEGWHGLYFTNPGFRDWAGTVYGTMGTMYPRSLQFIISYFTIQTSLGYDPHDENLMHNELMAYLMQQSVEATGAYFMRWAKYNLIQATIPELANYIIDTEGSDFIQAARDLSDYALEHWNLKAGRVSRVFIENTKK